MAYDPERHEVHAASTGEVADGHYANMADQVDAIYKPVDSVGLLQSAYHRAAGELNSLPVSERTAGIRTKVKELAEVAGKAALDANSEIGIA